MNEKIRKINERTERILEELVKIRRRLHQNPELSMQEYKTSQYIFNILTNHGIHAQVMNDGLGVTGLIEGKSQGDTIALRADMDALPLEETSALPFASGSRTAMHACGHDIHTTVLIGAAVVLNSMKDELMGNVRLIFQCGEEQFAGAKKAIEEGVLNEPKVSSILAFHTWPELDAGTIGLKQGEMMAASDGIRIKIQGKGGHAAHPQKVIDPVLISSYVLNALQAVVSREIPAYETAVLSIGKIAGGTAPNIIPSEVCMEGTVRSSNSQVRDTMRKKIADIVEYIPSAFGGQGILEYEENCPPLINDETLLEAARVHMGEMLGEEKVKFLKLPSTGSEDFAFYTQHVPGLLVRLGTGNEKPESRLPLHNPGILFDETSIQTGVSSMSNLVMALLKR